MAMYNPLLVGVEGVGTPEELDRLRAELAARQPQYGKASNVGEGIGQLLTGIGSGIQNYRLGKKQKAGEASATSARDMIYSALTGGASSPYQSTQGTSQPTQKPTTSPTPIPGSMNNARAADRNSVPGYAGLDLKSGIQQSANALGISPVDLATAISYETAGTMDPTKRGPTTQWGQHRGLIQFGEPQAQKYGVDFNNPISSQLGENGAVVKYLRDAGVRPGMGIMDIYSAINAGRVGRYGASDANNGGAPGTVADKVNNQMAGHRSKALAMFGEQAPGQTASADPQQAFQAVLGQQQAQPKAPVMPGATIGDKMLVYDDKGMRMEVPKPNISPPSHPYSGPGAQIDYPIIVYDDKGMRQESSLSYGRNQPQPQPQQAAMPQQAPQQMAQAAPQDQGVMGALGGQGQGQGANYFPPAPSQQQMPRGLDMPTLMKAAQNPWLDSATRSFVNGLIQQEMQKQSPEYQMQQQQKQLEMQKLQKEISAPAERKTVVVNGRLVDATTGQLVAEYPDQVKPTDDMREYEYAKTQGFQGSFVDFQLAQKRAGAQTINVGGGDNKQVFDAMMDSTNLARSASMGLSSLREAKAAVEGGIISGAGADARLGLQKIGALLGVADPGVIENTETFRSAIAPQVASTMKATVGSTQISNADREFAQQAAGGSINLDERSIRRLLDIMERAGTVAVQSHMERLNKVYPDNGQFERERALFGVAMPNIQGIMPNGAAKKTDQAPPAGPPNEGRKTTTGATWSIDQ